MSLKLIDPTNSADWNPAAKQEIKEIKPKGMYKR